MPATPEAFHAFSTVCAEVGESQMARIVGPGAGQACARRPALVGEIDQLAAPRQVRQPEGLVELVGHGAAQQARRPRS